MPSALPSSPDLNEAQRFLTLLDESADTFAFRVFDDNTGRKDPSLALKLEGSIDSVWDRLVERQAQGCGCYVVANAGSQTQDSIYRVRVVFADTDGAPLEPILGCGLDPHFVVESSPGNYHVYWLVDGLALDDFRGVQRTIAAQFGTDKSVNDLSRVMRLPGLFHLKGEPFKTRIIHESGALPYSPEAILGQFPPAAETEASPSTVAGLGPGVVVEHDRHADVVKYTMLLAQSVRSGAMTRDEAMDVMRRRVASGRYTRHVSDDEIARALNGALAKFAPTHVNAPPAFALDTFSDEDIAKASKPHPSAFMGGYHGQVGMFPVGEVTVIGAPGREGKTSAMMAIAQAYALGQPVGGLNPLEIRSVIIYSAEDDRSQYARKMGAHLTRLTPDQGAVFRKNLRVPDLHSEAVASWREIVTIRDRQPVRGQAVQALIDSVQPLMSQPCPPGLIIFETASTLSDAEEDNAGHKVMVASLKHIAKTLGVAVVLMHHTSQAASNNLPDLNVSEADIRGGTTLVNNSRQCFLLVNLGSDGDPFGENDARTLLRHMAAQGQTERISCLLCLNSSKSMDPYPVFFRWAITDDYGPCLVEVTPPQNVRGKSLKALKSMLSGARAEAKADAKAEQGQANVRLVVRAVHDLAEKGEQPTVRKVSVHCGRNPGWAKPYLEAAVEDGELVRLVEQVPRTKGMTDVFRPVPENVPWRTSGD